MYSIKIFNPEYINSLGDQGYPWIGEEIVDLSLEDALDRANELELQGQVSAILLHGRIWGTSLPDAILVWREEEGIPILARRDRFYDCRGYLNEI